MEVTNFTSNSLVVVLGLVIICSSQTILAQSISCRTADGKSGTCILPRRCTSIQEKIDSYGGYWNIPDELKNFVKKSTCVVPNARGLHICCPSNAKSGYEILDSQECGDIHGHRVAFGKEAKLQQFPFMALLEYDDENSPYKCGGTLISNRYILTAAHCLETRYNLIGIVLGEHDTSKERDCQKSIHKEICNDPIEKFAIERKIVHPNYSRANIVNDIALIKLNRTVVFKDHISPICLPLREKNNDLDFTVPYFISGWGTTENGTTSTKLLYAMLDLKRNQYCEDIYSRFFEKEHLCAVGMQREDSCRGDSGGPLFANRPYKNIHKYIQYGVVSFGVKGCGVSEQAFPGIYANIIQLLPWITDNIDE